MNIDAGIIWIYIVYVITLQMFIMLRILGAKGFEFRLARHLLFRKIKTAGVIVGFERGRWWEESGCPGDYISVVEYRMNDWKCRTKILRCEKDEIGQEVLLAVSKKDPSRAVRYEKQMLHGDTKGLSHAYSSMQIGIIADIFLLFLLRKIGMVMLISGIVCFLNYLCLPLYLNMRNLTW